MTTNAVKVSDLITIHLTDALTLLKSMPDSSVDLIATDPPYFKVKKDAWDNQWDGEVEFLAWLDEILCEYWRVLKPSGSLYLFCSDKLAAKTEVLIGQRFNVLNHIVWRKENGIHKRQHKEGLRRYFPQTERIIFAEHYGAEGFAKGSSGYDKKCSDLKADVFSPLIEYFSKAKEVSGISSSDINKATGTQMCSHWFSKSQWKLPNAEQYEKLQELFRSKGNASLNRPFSELETNFIQLNKSYNTLKAEHSELLDIYNGLRRQFKVSADVPYTDVWDFNPVQYYPGKHPCEKPYELMQHIVLSSSGQNAVVLDTFLGSGSTAKVCRDLGRHFIGCEMDADIFAATLKNLTE